MKWFYPVNFNTLEKQVLTKRIHFSFCIFICVGIIYKCPKAAADVELTTFMHDEPRASKRRRLDGPDTDTAESPSAAAAGIILSSSDIVLNMGASTLLHLL